MNLDADEPVDAPPAPQPPSSASKPHPWASLLRGETDWTTTAAVEEPSAPPVTVSPAAAPKPRGIRVAKASRGQALTGLADYMSSGDDDEGEDADGDDADGMDVDGEPIAADDEPDRSDEVDEPDITMLSSRAGTVDTHPEPEIDEGDALEQPDRSDDRTPIIELDDDAEEVRLVRSLAMTSTA